MHWQIAKKSHTFTELKRLHDFNKIYEKSKYRAAYLEYATCSFSY